jgi:hypothetical protein
MEGLRLFQTLQDQVGIVTAALPTASVVRDRGDLELARVLYVEALLGSRACGEQLLEAHTLNNLGWLELYAGNLAEARRLATDSLAIRRALNAQREAGVSLTLLARIAGAAGETAVAGRLFVESMAVHREVGNRWGIALTLEGVAAMVVATQPELAVRLTGVANATRMAIGRPQAPVEQAVVALGLEPALDNLGPERAARVWADGHTLFEADAVTEALEVMAALERLIGG